MKNVIKRYCLLLLALSPIVSVAFAAQSSLNVAQIRNGNASISDLKSGLSESGHSSDANNRN